MDTKRCSTRKCVVFTVCCLVAMVDFALILSFGTLFVQLLDTYGENRSTTATVQSLLIGVTLSSSVFSGILVEKFGTSRVSFTGSVLLSIGFMASFFARSILLLDIFIGVMAGIGISFLFVSSTVVVRNSFEGRIREVALAGINIFVGIGSVANPLMLNLVVNTYTLNGAFLILGGIYTNNFVVPILFFFHEKEILKQQKGMDKSERVESGAIESVEKDERISKTSCNVWKKLSALLDIRLTLVLIATGISLSSNASYLVVFNDIYAWKGFSSSDTLNLLLVFQVFNAVGRALPIIFSIITPGSDLLVLLMLCALSGCTGQALIYFSTTTGVAFAGNAFSGLTQGGLLSAGTVAVANISHVEHFGVSFGLLLTSVGTLTLLLGVLHGYIRDSIRSYELAIILTASLNGLGVILYLIAKFRSTMLQRRQTANQEENSELRTAVSIISSRTILMTEPGSQD